MYQPIENASVLHIGQNLIVIEDKGASYEAVIIDLGNCDDKVLMAIVESRPEAASAWKWERRVLHANDDGRLDMWDKDDESDGGEDMRDVRTVLVVG